MKLITTGSVGLLVLLGACASQSTVEAQNGASPATQSPPLVERVVPEAATSVKQAVTRPVSDLNLLRDEIPQVLQAASKAPYAEPVDRSCTLLHKEMRALDEALGLESGSAKPPAESTAAGKVITTVGDMTVDAVKGSVNTVVDGVVPMRSWVRRLSGAHDHEAAVAAAISAGVTRRSFLRGWAAGASCPASQQ